jgi:hypothetical protein
MSYIPYRPTHQRIPQDENEYPVDIKTHYDPYSRTDCDVDAYRDAVHKRNIRVLRFIIRMTTLGLATYGVVSQAMVLERFLNTRGIIRNNRNPWANGTVIWPTIVLLSTSSLTVLISLITLGSYCCSVKHANKISTNAGLPMSIAENVAHVVIWISTAVSYRAGKTGKDLWGWTCDPKANAIQKVFPEVNFDFLCGVQVRVRIQYTRYLANKL